MNALALHTAIAWIHALIAAGWVAAAGAFVIAAAAISQGGERSAFIRRAAPAINRVGAAAIPGVFLTGLINLSVVVSTRGYRLPTAFVAVLAAKVAIFIAMGAILFAAFRAERKLGEQAGADTEHGASARLIGFNAAIAGMGAVALILGLWLLGS